MNQSVAIKRIKTNVEVLRAQKSFLSHLEVVDCLFSQRIDWFELIKTLRMIYELDIFDSERLGLSHNGWRRWCQGRINSDPSCQKLARAHLNHHGAKALIHIENGQYVIKVVN